MDPVTIQLSTGLELTFAQLSVWDLMEHQAKFGDQVEEAVVAGDDATASQKNNLLKATYHLTYRSALAGGYGGTFEEFCNAIPLREQEAVVKAASPFLRKAEGSG